MSFILCDDWKALVFISLSIHWNLFNRHVLALFEANDLKEALILFFVSTIKVQCKYQNKKVPNKVSKWSSRTSYLLTFVLTTYYLVCTYYLLLGFNFWRFIYIWNVFKNSKLLWKHVLSNTSFFIFTRVYIIKWERNHIALGYIRLIRQIFKWYQQDDIVFKTE